MDIDDRVINMALVMLDGQKTVREVAKIVGYSKSTVHNDLTKKLCDIDYELFLKVRSLLEYNKKIRHIRGGEATRMKYLSGFQ
ncbi:MAG: sporulation transcriptional regulator SpoIIID [Anaeroplasma sp.]